MDENVTNVPNSPEEPGIFSMSGDELFCAIIKRLAYTVRRRLPKVEVARVFVAISSLQSMSDEAARTALDPMVLFEVATRIDAIVKANGLEEFVIGGPPAKKEKENNGETREKQAAPGGSEGSN